MVKIDVLVQPTHYFLFNGNDALGFSIIKSNARKIAAKRWPKNLKDLRNVWDKSVEHVSDHAIQTSIKRSYSHGPDGVKKFR